MIKALVFTLFALCVLAEEAAPISDVVDLTAATFDQAKTGDWLVKFYAPWCGHCKNLAPTWEELATKSKGKFNVAKIDCTIHKGKDPASYFRF
jgi:thioredoxin-like negative regulator of GroEL